MTAPRTAARLARIRESDRNAGALHHFQNKCCQDRRFLLALLDEAEADRSLLLDAALRALVAAVTDYTPAPSEAQVDALVDAVHAARAALAATDVRGALAEALPVHDDHDPADVDPHRFCLTYADAILDALAAKGVEG